MPQFNLEDYVQVNERLEKFRADHPSWGLSSEVIYRDDKTFIVRAAITDENDRIIATGMAEEVRGSSPVNRTSPLENCETSAWGRALANLGYDVRRSIASREEMEKVERQSKVPSATATTRAPRAGTARGAAKGESPAPPSPPGPDLDQLRGEMFSKVKSLNPKEIETFKGWMSERGIGFDFSALTFEQIQALEVELVENYQSPF